MPPVSRSILFYENEDLERVEDFVKKGYRTTPILFINGSRVEGALAARARPNQSLISFLRDVMHLTGTKLGCNEGGCGACTVQISKWDCVTGHIKHFAVNACLMPVLAADCCHVTTVEGVGTVNGDRLHPVQRAMVDMHGSQCGFCTPGIIVNLYTLLSNNPSVAHLEEHLDGNLCRCTGYRPIWDAARSLCQDGEAAVRGPCGTPCRVCPGRDTCIQECNVEDDLVTSSSKDKMRSYTDRLEVDRSWLDQPNQMFPEDLKHENSEFTRPLIVVDKTVHQAGGTWFKPTTLFEMLLLLKEFENDSSGPCKIVVGNTEVGIEQKFKHKFYPRLISPSDSIRDIFAFDLGSSQLRFGSCCPLSSIQQQCRQLSETHPRLRRTLLPIHDMLRWFASSQIRNVACLGGNLATASPISDMNPLLVCMNANLVISSVDDERSSIVRRHMPVEKLFLGYRSVDLSPAELIERIEIPIAQSVFEYIYPFKQSRRREDDISIVTSGMRMRLNISGDKFIISDMKISFGGMAPTTVMAIETAKSLIDSEFNEESFEKAVEILVQEMNLPDQVPGGQAAYRTTLAASFLSKFFLLAVQDLERDISFIRDNPTAFASISSPLPSVPTISAMKRSGASNWLAHSKPSFYGRQTYPVPKVVSGLEDKLYPAVESEKQKTVVEAVGKAYSHSSGALHCTGEADYTDDIPVPHGTLHAALILSSQCDVVLESIDKDSALAIPGVRGIITCDDLVSIGGNNTLGPIVSDETVFLPIGEKIHAIGAVLGVAVAESLEAAELAARTVNIKYGESSSEKIIVSIDDAIEANSFYEFSRHSLHRGDEALLDALQNTPDTKTCPKIGDIVKISGFVRSGPQEHFYLEPNATLVIPSESDTNLTIYCSTQAVNKTQMCCASAAGLQAHKIVVRVKRMGGGFGGKETRNVFASAATAVAARCLNKPVKLVLPRNTDMKTTGQRHAFKSEYQASARFTEDGLELLAMDVKIFVNGGYAFDLSGPVLDRALFHCDGVYYFPNFRCGGVVCKTVQAPHTAFRGFGGPQGMVIAEHVMDHFSIVTGISGDTIRRGNMYKIGDAVPFGMVIGETDSGSWHIPAMWDRLYSKLDVADRRSSITEFNAKHKWIKRGLAVVPTKFGIAFTAKYMNQGGSLVHLYTDGSVLVSHGGTEMGQGLHTKVCQVAAQAFSIPMSQVYVNDSSSDKVANAIPTAASMSTDQYGMATLDACRQIVRRLQSIREQLGPKASLKDIAKAAHFARIDLTAHGFYALTSDRCGFDWTKEKPADWPTDLPQNSWKGHPFNYFTQGVCVAECEIDVLTGNHRTLRADVLVDVGSSINPGIDIGQIEGAFVQGMGWSTIEDFIHADDDHPWVRPRGDAFTTGPGTYKIPAFNDVPEVFNVSLLENADNPLAVHSSKAVGEPPFFLGASVFFAIKDALRAARLQNLGKDEYFEMRLPATSERIRMYAADGIAAKVVAQSRTSENAIERFQPQGSF